MKGRGFHQSDTAHHLHWGLCESAGEFSVLGVAPPCVSFDSEADACWEGQTLAPSERAVPRPGRAVVGQGAGRCLCCVRLLSVELSG